MEATSQTEAASLLRDLRDLAHVAKTHGIRRTIEERDLDQTRGSVPKTLLSSAPAGTENTPFTAANIVH